MSLISRGFCLLRDSLSRSEVTTVAIIMGFVYLGFSAYLIQPDDLAPFLLIIIGGLFFLNSRSNIKNIKLLQIRFFNLQQANIRIMLPDISRKIKILKWNLIFSYFFYLNEVTKVTIICIGQTIQLEGGNSFWFIQSTTELSVVSITLFAIFFIFRSKQGIAAFNASMIIPDNLYPIAPILSARVPESNILPNDRPAIVICPQNYINGKI